MAEFPLPPSGATGMDDPLEDLRQAHERARRMVELLIRLREHLRDHGADPRGVVTAAAIRQYFAEEWPRHMQDEEVDLMPRVRARLRERPLPHAAAVLETIDSVLGQHRTFEALLQRILTLLRDVESGISQRLDEPTVQAFVQLYRIHIALEEDVLAPAYEQLLTAEDLAALRHAMAQRRQAGHPGADPPL